MGSSDPRASSATEGAFKLEAQVSEEFQQVYDAIGPAKYNDFVRASEISWVKKAPLIANAKRPPSSFERIMRACPLIIFCPRCAQ